ncbi:hypothetical protein SOM26_04990 [Sphingomonas sp. CFBP8993]|uniref:hypothetical protein n=1 Tax=Sphingomonas sp. CFBP8993 TaxID=3096526 RepID=UPI002A69F48C|nr:hypothetical protein [Sphingomonas sp. CFBP8993]MDY0958037.1 hypothetical protein [Sphingomonas sp. CFBP8993]
MAGALVEIWLTISALSSLVIIMIALGNSDLRRDKRLRIGRRRPATMRTMMPRTRRARP